MVRRGGKRRRAKQIKKEQTSQLSSSMVEPFASGGERPVRDLLHNWTPPGGCSWLCTSRRLRGKLAGLRIHSTQATAPWSDNHVKPTNSTLSFPWPRSSALSASNINFNRCSHSLIPGLRSPERAGALTLTHSFVFTLYACRNVCVSRSWST